MKANAALYKRKYHGVFGLFVLGQAVYRLVFPQVPLFEAIGAIGLLALAALFLRSALFVLRGAITELRASNV